MHCSPLFERIKNSQTKTGVIMA